GLRPALYRPGLGHGLHAGGELPLPRLPQDRAVGLVVDEELTPRLGDVLRIRQIAAVHLVHQRGVGSEHCLVVARLGHTTESRGNRALSTLFALFPPLPPASPAVPSPLSRLLL